MRVHHILAMALAVLIAASAPVVAQDVTAPPEDPRAATGGAQTLEDILARQRGEEVDYDFRRNATGAQEGLPVTESHLGVLGGASDSEVFRALRYNTANITASSGGPAANVIIQDDGMWWLQFRDGPLSKWGGYSLLGMIGVLIAFFLLRGRIRIDGEKTGETVERFNAPERFGHWLLAGSFVLLALTGLLTLFGKELIVLLFAPAAEVNGAAQAGVVVGGTERHGWALMGEGGYAAAKASMAPLLQAGKWIHNNVAWAFMLGLVWVFVFWVLHNIPNRHDVVWLLKGGGLFSKGVHPPAKKFNAGQKLIFWAVIVLGVSVSASGLSLLFPFELPMFAVTFEKVNALGIPAMIGMEPLPTTLTPQAEMQYAQVWHGIVAFAMTAIIIAHIYLGSIGMEGAFDAMGSGQVEKQWAKEHHGLWVEELEAKGKLDPGSSAKATPAE